MRVVQLSMHGVIPSSRLDELLVTLRSLCGQRPMPFTETVYGYHLDTYVSPTPGARKKDTIHIRIKSITVPSQSSSSVSSSPPSSTNTTATTTTTTTSTSGLPSVTHVMEMLRELVDNPKVHAQVVLSSAVLPDQVDQTRLFLTASGFASSYTQEFHGYHVRAPLVHGAFTIRVLRIPDTPDYMVELLDETDGPTDSAAQSMANFAETYLAHVATIKSYRHFLPLLRSSAV